MGRAPCCDKANVKKGPWSPEEDSKLKEYIGKYGTGGNWIALPQKAGTCVRRCAAISRGYMLNIPTGVCSRLVLEFDLI